MRYFLLLTLLLVAACQPTLPITPTPTEAAVSPTPEVTSTPENSLNAEWTPVEQDFSGITMVLVPAGCFEMGSMDYDNEQPVHEQCIDQPFWMDKTEVTQAQFKRLNGTQAEEPAFTGDNRPVERVTWHEARDFCTLRESRLPTEVEWEYAARGPDNLPYPWGNEWDETNAVFRDNSSNQTADVGSHPNGASWVGALDMIGNVWEWTGSVYEAYPYDASDGREREPEDSADVVFAQRGGSWDVSRTEYLRTASRAGILASGNYTSGFRCVRTAD